MAGEEAKGALGAGGLATGRLLDFVGRGDWCWVGVTLIVALCVVPERVLGRVWGRVASQYVLCTLKVTQYRTWVRVNLLLHACSAAFSCARAFELSSLGLWYVTSFPFGSLVKVTSPMNPNNVTPSLRSIVLKSGFVICPV